MHSMSLDRLRCLDFGVISSGVWQAILQILGAWIRERKGDMPTTYREKNLLQLIVHNKNIVNGYSFFNKFYD